jgi:hypothetical protein
MNKADYNLHISNWLFFTSPFISTNKRIVSKFFKIVKLLYICYFPVPEVLTTEDLRGINSNLICYSCVCHTNSNAFISAYGPHTGSECLFLGSSPKKIIICILCVDSLAKPGRKFWRRKLNGTVEQFPRK